MRCIVQFNYIFDWTVSKDIPVCFVLRSMCVFDVNMLFWNINLLSTSTPGESMGETDTCLCVCVCMFVCRGIFKHWHYHMTNSNIVFIMWVFVVMN